MPFREADYASADASALAQAVARGEVTAQALLTMACERAQRLQAALGAISQFAEPLGRAAIEQLPHGAPFAGVPLVVKDLGAPLAGLPTLAGSRALRQAAPATADGELIARLRAAGFVPFAKTTVPEFGLSLASEPLVGPACRNPWAPAFSAGGSSGGAAAAVAAGIVPVAHATDAGGSIRIPAAACGVLGLRPGRGAIARGPDYGNVFGNLASEFVITRSVRDSTAVWHWATRQPAPMRLPLLRPQRIGLLLQAPQGVAVDAEWRAAASSAAAILASAGHAVHPLSAPRLQSVCADAASAFATYACRSAAAAVEWLAPAPQDLEPITWAAARRGAALTAGQHQLAEVAVARATDDMAALFDEIDVLLTPALARALPGIGTLRADVHDLDQHLAQFDHYAPFAALANASGCPAISVPHGRDARGRPLAIQMVAAIGQEPALLALAQRLETAHPWPLVASV
ncbi:amidase [Xylophilus sp. ASV27]|uniref:amidase n=1 Tax=Xylophilus sp. ASV27 TaxID=2795129 RepID=UPI0018EB370E|nr:amidase family protein [Xylophilus sp. ASV27]